MNEGVSWGLFVFIDQSTFGELHLLGAMHTNACCTPFRVGVGSCPSGRGLTSMSAFGDKPLLVLKTMSEHSDPTTKGFRQLLYLTGSWSDDAISTDFL